MKISNELKCLIEALAFNSSKSRELNRLIFARCEKEGIDTDNLDFISAYSYVEGDCDTTQIFSHLESL